MASNLLNSLTPRWFFSAMWVGERRKDMSIIVTWLALVSTSAAIQWTVKFVVSKAK